MPDESQLTGSFRDVLEAFRALEAEGLPPYADSIRARIGRPIGVRAVKNIVSRLRLLGHIDAGRTPRRFAVAPKGEGQASGRPAPDPDPAPPRVRPHSTRFGEFAAEATTILRVMRWARRQASEARS